MIVVHINEVTTKSGISCHFDQKVMQTYSKYMKSKNFNRVFLCDLLSIKQNKTVRDVNFIMHWLKFNCACIFRQGLYLLFYLMYNSDLSNITPYVSNFKFNRYQ